MHLVLLDAICRADSASGRRITLDAQVSSIRGTTWRRMGQFSSAGSIRLKK
jgi:hypothetical protein